MYNYASLKKVDGTITAFEPSDNMSINGVPLDQLIEGYRHLTVTGTLPAPSCAAAHNAATSAGSRIRQAPKRPDCTRSDGHPTLILLSS